MKKEGDAFGREQSKRGASTAAASPPPRDALYNGFLTKKLDGCVFRNSGENGSRKFCGSIVLVQYS